MDKDDHTRQRLIRQAVARNPRTGDTQPVARALRAWERLALHLSPFIGEAGYCALYGRALRLASSLYPALTPSLPAQTIDALFSSLKENLTSIDPATAGEANLALLDTFTKLLSGLIGEALTTRLLNIAWADEPEGKQNE